MLVGSGDLKRFNWSEEKGKITFVELLESQVDGNMYMMVPVFNIRLMRAHHC